MGLSHHDSFQLIKIVIWWNELLNSWVAFDWCHCREIGIFDPPFYENLLRQQKLELSSKNHRIFTNTRNTKKMLNFEERLFVEFQQRHCRNKDQGRPNSFVDFFCLFHTQICFLMYFVFNFYCRKNRHYSQKCTCIS